MKKGKSCVFLLALPFKWLCKYINNSKLCSRWIRWSMLGHLLWTTMWPQPSADPASIHRSHSLAFCWLDWRRRSASSTLCVSQRCFYSRPQTLHLSLSLLQLSSFRSLLRLADPHCLMRVIHAHIHTHRHAQSLTHPVRSTQRIMCNPLFLS